MVAFSGYLVRTVVRLQWKGITGGKGCLGRVLDDRSSFRSTEVRWLCTKASSTENILVYRTKEYIYRPSYLVFPCHLTEQPTRILYIETTTNPYAHPWAAPRFARQRTDSTASAPDTWSWRE